MYASARPSVGDPSSGQCACGKCQCLLGRRHSSSGLHLFAPSLHQPGASVGVFENPRLVFRSFFKLALNYPLNLPLKNIRRLSVLRGGLEPKPKMQLPNIDRTPNLRSSAEAASSVSNRVIPVAPVNPTATSTPLQEPMPSAIDKVNPALKVPLPHEGEPNHTSVPDPTRKSSVSEVAPRDWTIHRPAPQKVEDPPPKPISQVLLDHLKTVWTASASAVQIEQVKNQLSPPVPASPAQQPGELAKQALVYQPSKITKPNSI